MALFVVATPIGNSADFSLRALEVLKSAELVIGEELKALRQILKAAGVQAPSVDQLNEHSRPADVAHLLERCRVESVALVSDCGTPGFCDPGADLVGACHRAGVTVHTVPGPSSLMALLSVCGIRVDRFLFLGFLPAKTAARETALREVSRMRDPCIVMETPYRTAKWLAELAELMPNRFCVVGLSLTRPTERVVRGLARDLAKQGPFDDLEPVTLIMPDGYREG